LNQNKESFFMDTIVEKFEKQVATQPHSIAVVFEEEQISYLQLNKMANQLGFFLRQRYAIKPEDRVAIMIERSHWMIVVILAILKAGAAYVPIDRSNPDERIDYLLNDAAVKLVIVNDSEAENICVQQFFDTLHIEDVWREIVTAPDQDLPPVNSPADLAYLIYTSGSTGTPKGVMVEHRNLICLLFMNNAMFHFGNKDVWTLFHSISFDFSVWEIFGALLYGGRLVVVPKNAALDFKKFAKLVIKEKVTILNQVPSVFYLVQTEIMNRNSGEDNNVRCVVLGGEALDPPLLDSWLTAFPKIRVVNMYGITETTVHVTFKEIRSEDLSKGISNIGKPLHSHFITLMNEEGLTVTEGIGEIVVGGEGVSRGYWRREQLTAERFIPDSLHPGRKLYRSGDLAETSALGEFIYKGRKDNQVKINGYRIELSEIDQTIMKFGNILRSIVLVKEVQGDKILVAYFKSTASINVDELRKFCRRTLPAYMIPAKFIEVEQFPLTNNGKIDNRALLQITEAASVT
jgi:amino acid adenylation domain-containing protein